MSWTKDKSFYETKYYIRGDKNIFITAYELFITYRLYL